MKVSRSLSIKVALLGASMLALAAPAVAQGTEEQKSACMGDAFQYCGPQIPNVPEIEACLKQNVERLTPACKAEFVPTNSTRIKREHFRT